MAETRHLDKDLEVYRNLLEEPKDFQEGFGWSTVAGIFFCGLVMLPGSIYLGLMTGGSMGAASTWVTLILFIEARKSNVIAHWPQVPGFRGSNGEQPITLLTRNSITRSRGGR
jgi:hypothetical protein